MNRKLFETIFYIKYGLKNPGLLRKIAVAWNNQFISPQEIEEMRFHKMRNLISHAHENSPFYRKKFQMADFHPSDLKELKDMDMIPLLSKVEIRENLDNMLATNIPSDRRKTVNTSGTTGTPLTFYHDQANTDWMLALYLRTIKTYGCSLGSKTAWIWGLKKEDELLDFSWSDFKSQHLKNVTRFNGFDMTPERMTAFAKFSFSYKPELIITYVSSIYEYASFLKQNQIRFRSPKAIWLTAEPVDAMQRNTIEEVFGCPTFSQYGSSEILHIANECSAHQGLHIHADSRYVEITDKDGNVLPPEQPGYIVVTDLENYVMPLIRYKNDDMSSLRTDKCTCGSNFPKLNPVMGRVYNVFKLKSGKQIYGHMFSRKLFNYVGVINQFQIHQVAYDEIMVNLVPGKLEDKNRLEHELLSFFKYYTGEEVKYSFHYVDKINKEKSGKLLYTKSDVK